MVFMSDERFKISLQFTIRLRTCGKSNTTANKLPYSDPDRITSFLAPISQGRFGRGWANGTTEVRKSAIGPKKRLKFASANVAEALFDYQPRRAYTHENGFAFTISRLFRPSHQLGRDVDACRSQHRYC